MTESEITTEVQRQLGQRLSQVSQTTPLRCGERVVHQGVEIPVTASGRY